MTKTLSSLS